MSTLIERIKRLREEAEAAERSRPEDDPLPSDPRSVLQVADLPPLTPQFDAYDQTSPMNKDEALISSVKNFLRPDK